MSKALFLETEKHNGFCGHCMSQVNLEATTCHSCKAYWGLRNGLTRNELLTQANTQIKSGLRYVGLMTIMFFAGILGFEFFLVPFLIGLLFFPIYLGGKLLRGILNKRTAQNLSNGIVDWWIRR